MKNFYIQQKKLQSEDFNFMENIHINNLCLLDFLHGFCNIFALCLHNIYHYEIMNVYNYDKSLIHSFCIYHKNNKRYFIDIRGITTDLNEFLIDFENWIDIDDFFEHPSDNTYYILKTDEDKRIYSACEKIIKKYNIYF